MNRTDQIQRWRRERRQRGGPHLGKWTLGVGAGCLLVQISIVLSIVLGSATATAAVYNYFAQGLPDLERIEVQEQHYETVKIYDRTGTHLLYESIDPRPFRGDRTYLPIDQIPKMVLNATIALEDRDFYENAGVNFRGLPRALWSNLQGRQVQGGSSITQQLVKNTLIPASERYEVSYARKIKETIMALELTRKHPGVEGKNKIIEWYINHNFYGNAAYGIEAAAQVYYDKSAGELTVDEVAVLAAIPQYPGLNPITSPADAYRRQRKVLLSMTEAGYLTQDEADDATRYFNTSLLQELIKEGYLSNEDMALVAVGNKAATARALNALAKADYLTQAEADEAKRLSGSLWQYVRESATERFEVPPDAPHFALQVLQQLENRYNTPEDPYFIWQNGLRVYTTLDWDLQVYAECAARSHVAALSVKEPKPCQGNLLPSPAIPYLQQAKERYDHEVGNASVVAIRPNTGEVLAMVGSIDYFDKSIDGQVNVALSPSRQPGSSFKPFTYLTAFMTGEYSPSSMVMDVRTVFPNPPNAPYAPENYDRTYHGPQTLRWALQRSYNIPAVWLMDKVGVGNVIRLARRMGLSSLDRELKFYGLALTLGGGEVRLVDMTYAFSVLANNGVMAGKPVAPELQRPGYRLLDPVYVLQVQNKDGQVIDEYRQPAQDPIINPAVAYMMNDVLSDTSPRPVAFGIFADYLKLSDRPVAAKTGTTNNFVDDWTIGYTPQLAIGVWAGNSNSKHMKESSGSLGAAPIWHAVMEKGMQGLPVQKWQQPAGLQRVKVCVPSGLLAGPGCPQTADELFLQGKAPNRQDDMWQTFEINKTNGKLASACTPADAIEKKSFQVFPLNAADYVRDQKIPQPPTEADGPCEATATGDVAIAKPLLGDRVKGSVEIRGNARGGNFRAYRLEVAPARTENWQPITEERGEQISDGVLGVWTATAEGSYTIRLSVYRHDGNVTTTQVVVSVDNTPPTVKIVGPFADEEFVMEDIDFLSLSAEARDNAELDRVEFILDGRSLGDSLVAPYGIRWKVAMAGAGPETHRVKAKAYDKAGNTAESPEVRFRIVHKQK